MITLMQRIALVIAVSAALFAGATQQSTQSASGELPPEPIHPNRGEAVLLDVVNSLSLKDIRTALDHFPVPYVVVASGNGASPTIANNKAGSPTRIDADSNKNTGTGGQDIQIEVNTELNPVPHLRVNITRIGKAPFAQNVKVVVAFPWNAFNGEDALLPGEPNLFMGFQTTGNFRNDSYPAGGILPVTTEIRFVPNAVAGLDHGFQVTTATTGSSNPARFIAGHFDGTNLTGILNADAQSILTDPVPASFTLGLGVSNNALSSAPAHRMNSRIALDWTASAPAKVIFDYLEDETRPGTRSDYNSTLTFDRMPTREQISIDLKEAEDKLTIAHQANAPIGKVTLLHERNDELAIQATATDVPTQVNLQLNMAGCAQLDVNANTLDLNLTATESTGFADTDDFLGYDVGYLGFRVIDAPDMSGCYSQPTNSVSIQATNAGENIPLVELAIGDDANLELPPVQTGPPLDPMADLNRHVFSLVDDGGHGTAFVRMVHLVNANFNLSSTGPKNITQAFTFTTSAPAPLTAYFKNKTPSLLIPHPPNDVEVTCNLEDLPAGGPSTMTLTYPTELNLDIDPLKSLHCFGHIDSLDFDIDAADIPEKFKYKLDPYGSLRIETTLKDLIPNKAKVGRLAVRITDPNGLDNPVLTDLVGVPLKTVRIRVDDMYSFVASWEDKPGGSKVDFNTGVPDAILYAGGAQVDVSTIVPTVREHLPAAGPTADDYITYVDGGPGQDKRIAAGVFGLDHFNYASTEGSGARSLAASYDANADHKLVARIDTRKGGRFFPDYDINATATVDKVPATLVFTTDLATNFKVAASKGIDSIAMEGRITVDSDETRIDVLAKKLPSAMQFVLKEEEEGSAVVTTTGTIEQLRFDLQSDTKIMGKSPYKHLFGDVNAIPADVTAEWKVTPRPKVRIAPGQPLGKASFIVSRIKVTDEHLQYAPFRAAGSDVEQTGFAREIDRRYFGAGPAPASGSREQLFMGRIDDIYQSSSQLDAGEDHAVMRKNLAGKVDFISAQITGLKFAEVELLQDGAKGTLELASTGPHPFYAGIETERELKPIDLVVSQGGPSVSYGSDTLTDSSKNFTPNEFQNQLVKIPDLYPYGGGFLTTYGQSTLVDPTLSGIAANSVIGLKLAVDRVDVFQGEEGLISLFSSPTYGANSLSHVSLVEIPTNDFAGLTIEVPRMVWYTGGPDAFYASQLMEDPNQSWAPNRLVGAFVEAGGERHRITSNTSTKLVLSEAWGTAPPKGTAYSIVADPEAHRIASNNEDEVILVENWRAVPFEDTPYTIFRPAEEHWIQSNSGTTVTTREPWEGQPPRPGTNYRIYRKSETHGIKSHTATQLTLHEPWLDGVPPPAGTAYTIFKLVEVGTFLTSDIANLPGKTEFDVTSSAPTEQRSLGSVKLTFSESAGRVELYKGDLPRGLDFRDALKVVLPVAPTSANVSFDTDSESGVFDTPEGNVHIHLSAPTEIRILSQSGDSRMVGAMVLKDVDAEWGTNTFRLGADCNFNPFDGPVGCDVRLVLIEVAFDADASPGLQGFFSLYGKDGSPHFINSASAPRPRAFGEYVPSLTTLSDGVTHVEAGVGLGKCLSFKIPQTASCLASPINLIARGDINGPFNADWWDKGDPALIFGNEDYVENNPWHLFPLDPSPLPHSFDDHVTPFD